MNRTTHRSRLGIVLAAFALTFVAACGTEVATAPAQIDQPVPSGPQPGTPGQQCHGSPQYGGVVCEDSPKLKSKKGGGDSGLARHGSGPEGWT